MKTPVRILIIAVVVFAAIAAFALKGKKPTEGASGEASGSTALTATAAGDPLAGTHIDSKLPRLLDLGAGKCIPCKMMKPILDDLKQNYSQAFITEFIDVWENREAGKPYGIETIPTQIFYDAEGKELFRHQGFYSKEDILAKWKELGITLPANQKS
jgi:thioredoxin 1